MGAGIGVAGKRIEVGVQRSIVGQEDAVIPIGTGVGIAGVAHGPRDHARAADGGERRNDEVLDGEVGRVEMKINSRGGGGCGHVDDDRGGEVGDIAIPLGDVAIAAELHAVDSGGETGEGVVATGIGGSAAHQCLVLIINRHGGAGQSGVGRAGGDFTLDAAADREVGVGNGGGAGGESDYGGGGAGGGVVEPFADVGGVFIAEDVVAGGEAAEGEGAGPVTGISVGVGEITGEISGGIKIDGGAGDGGSGGSDRAGDSGTAHEGDIVSGDADLRGDGDGVGRAGVGLAVVILNEIVGVIEAEAHQGRSDRIIKDGVVAVGVGRRGGGKPVG